MTTATRTKIYSGDDLAMAMERSRRDFGYFLRHHVFLPVRDEGGQVTGVMQWQWWPVHDEMLADLALPLLCVLKARQISWTWFLAALHLHGAIFTRNYLGAVISAGEVESAEFLAKARFILTHLPWETIPSLAKDNSAEMRFAAGDGTLLAFPSTAKAGRGFTFTRTVVDEAAFHPYAEANYASYLAASEHGQVIIVSSAGDADRTIVSDWFQRHWEAAQRGENDFAARFYPWSVRPGRDEAWYERQRQRYSSNPGQLHREYPSSPEEAFRSMLTLRFDTEALADGRRAIREPIEPWNNVPAVPAAYTKYVKVWAYPRPGIPYVAYTDVAEGKGRDYTVTAIMEARTYKVVAAFREHVLEPGLHGQMAVLLCRWYNNALWGVERLKGEAVLYVAGQSGYQRLYFHETPRTRNQIRLHQEPRASIGFPLTEHTRAGLIDDLAQVITDRALDMPDAEFWTEADHFLLVQTAGDRYKPQAAPGYHDDYIMTVAGLCRMAKQPGAQAMLSGASSHRAASRYGYKAS